MNRRGFLGSLAAVLLGAKLADRVELNVVGDGDGGVASIGEGGYEAVDPGGLAWIDDGAFEPVPSSPTTTRSLKEIWSQTARDMADVFEVETSEWQLVGWDPASAHAKVPPADIWRVS
jgi:hypothetical protein